MSQPRIIVQVLPDGETRLKADGFQGGGCVAATAEFEKSLGISAQRDYTAEFFQTTQAQTELNAGNSPSHPD